MNDKILYLECYSGISGDMTVAALLDLGADQQVLLAGLDSLHVEGYKIVIGRREKNSIDAGDFNVLLDSEEQEHHHYDGLEHGHKQEHDHNHDLMLEHKYTHDHHLMQDHDYSHGHDHGNNHDHHHSHTPIQYGHHEHRNLSEINEIIEQSGITDRAKEIAKKIFYIVAVAEAKAHKKSIEEVHFHEVGAIDSIVDIVAAAICLDNLDIHEVVVSELYEGTGFIQCQHGLLPIPVPAVINITAQHQLPLHITSVKGELVTPTGAAIAAAIRTREELPARMKVHKIGLGAGKRNYAGASGLLRAMLIEEISQEKAEKHSDEVWVLEANIDDCSGEVLGYAMELLLKNGAKDVYYTPIFMKKNRPAYLLGVICSEEQLRQVEEIIFTHTTTIGIRKTKAERTTLSREIITVTTAYGDALVKVCFFGERKFYYPEYESVKKLCEKSGMDYNTMYHQIQLIAMS